MRKNGRPLEVVKAGPEKLGDVERLEMNLWNERLNHVQTTITSLQSQFLNAQTARNEIANKRNAMAMQLRAKYAMTDNDQFDPETGVITRGAQVPTPQMDAPAPSPMPVEEPKP